MSTLMIALAVLVPILESRRLVKRARRACGDMLLQVHDDLEFMRLSCSTIGKDQKLLDTTFGDRFANLETQLALATERIQKLEETPDVKAKAASAKAIQELVNRQS